MALDSKALDRAKEALKLMDKGTPITVACKKAHTSYGTVRKAMRQLKKTYRTKLTKTARGRKRVIVDAYRVTKAMEVARKMQWEGRTATEAARECHTKIKTVKDAKIEGCRLLRYSRGRYRLQVFEVRKYGVVFYGRLRNQGSPVAITHTADLEVPETFNRAGLDDYASVVWQYDFDVFNSTLSPTDLCNYYLGLVRRFLDRGVDIERTFKLGVELDDESRCGVDDRNVKSEWVCKSALKQRATDDGFFQVLVIRRKTTARYPRNPTKVPYHHPLLNEVDWKEDH